MAVKMVREPSEIPSISNVDDFVGLRYAYGNQDGFVINKLNECSYKVIGNTFKVNSGRLVLQGVETDIDANGSSIIIDSIATKRFYSVYLEVNLERMTSLIKSSYDTAGYPTIEKGDDLTKVTNGIAKMLLYTFDATNGIITNVQKKINAIAYSGTALVGYDILKGTIEERLTNLGFKEGVAKYTGTTSHIINNSLKKQGKYVIFNFQATNVPANTDLTIIIPDEFKPKETVRIICGFIVAGIPMFGEYEVNSDTGIINISGGSENKIFVQMTNCGWETN